jgi:hypothetical protein
MWPAVIDWNFVVDRNKQIFIGKCNDVLGWFNYKNVSHKSLLLDIWIKYLKWSFESMIKLFKIEQPMAWKYKF